MAPSEYVDDMDVAERGVYWLLSIDVDRQRGLIRVTHDGGQTWVKEAAPSRGLAAGSKGRIQAFDGQQALLTQYWANGPLAALFRTDDAGASWHNVFSTDLGRRP